MTATPSAPRSCGSRSTSAPTSPTCSRSAAPAHAARRGARRGARPGRGRVRLRLGSTASPRARASASRCRRSAHRDTPSSSSSSTRASARARRHGAVRAAGRRPQAALHPALRQARRHARARARGRCRASSARTACSTACCRARRRPRDADDRHAARPVSVRRRAVVLDRVRPRRDDHRAGDAVVRPADRARRAALPRRAPGDGRGRRRRREPGKILHEMREARWRALGEVPFGRYYGCVDATPLFVDARRRCTTSARATAPSRLVAERRARARVDRPLRRPRRRRLHRLRARQSNRAAQPGLEGLAGLGVPRRRPLAEAPIALCEVQGYAYAAWRERGAARVRPGREAALRRAGAKADQLCGALRGRVLVRGPRHLRPRARRRQARPCRVRTSNAGHCCVHRHRRPERAARVARA